MEEIPTIELVHPKEGDTVILKLKKSLTNEQRAKVLRRFKEKFFPNNQVLIFDNEATIEVIPGGSLEAQS